MQDVLNFVRKCAIPHYAETVLYTVCLGGYDKPNMPNISREIPCYFISDRKVEDLSERWQQVVIDNLPSDTQRSQRYLKTLSTYLFPNAHRSIYCDAAVHFQADISPLVNRFKHHDFVALRHQTRECIYDEARACIYQNKDSTDSINNQMSRYLKEGYPANYGCYATPFLIRNHKSETVKNTCKIWAEEIFHGSKRDQLSLPYAAWKAEIEIKALPINPFFNPYIISMPHAGVSLTEKAKRKVAVNLYLLGLYKRNESSELVDLLKATQ